jgi:hypothetical protein
LRTSFAHFRQELPEQARPVAKAAQETDNLDDLPGHSRSRADNKAIRQASFQFDCLRGGSMAHTNRGRVIMGGLLTGVVINIVEFITNGVVLSGAWGQAMQALGKPAALSARAIVIFNIWGFLYVNLRGAGF